MLDLDRAIDEKYEAIHGKSLIYLHIGRRNVHWAICPICLCNTPLDLCSSNIWPNQTRRAPKRQQEASFAKGHRRFHCGVRIAGVCTAPSRSDSPPYDWVQLCPGHGETVNELIWNSLGRYPRQLNRSGCDARGRSECTSETPQSGTNVASVGAGTPQLESSLLLCDLRRVRRAWVRYRGATDRDASLRF
jgi:hypothetical protein